MPTKPSSVETGSAAREPEFIVQIIPIDGPLGAEVRGIDLSEPLSPAILDTVKRAWLDHLVLFFRQQTLTDAQIIRFGQYFGALHRVEYQDHLRPAGVPPEIEIVSNVTVDGRAIGLLGNSEVAWHTDMSMWDEPASATILYGEEVPSVGGGTRFCNLYAAWEQLDEDLQRKVDGRRSIHDSAYMANGQVRAGFQPVEDRSQGPGARHPVVRTHPETGKRALYLGRADYGYILGLQEDESDELLRRLWGHMTQPAYVWEHCWQKGDVLLWDNRCTAHSRGAISAREPRILRRVTVKGGVPF